MKTAIFAAILLAFVQTMACAGLDDLAMLGKPQLKRVSTFDKTGANQDKFIVKPGTAASLEIQGAGCIKHLWFTLASKDADYLSKTQIRIYWDGAKEASVDCPFGNFFCLGHGEVNDITSAAICVTKAPHISSPPGQAAFNCYFPMPFTEGAKLEIENGGSADLTLYAQADYEAYDSPKQTSGMGRFCANYLQEQTTPAAEHSSNTTGNDNYVILNIQGEGHYVGCNLSVNAKPTEPGKWYEGDDMIFVDDEQWPPSINGTGTEDYFNNAWGFRREFCTPYYGCSYLRKDGSESSIYGRFTIYRFHIQDPISFQKSIRVTVEHGHANDAGNHYSSVAYWYQKPAGQQSVPTKKHSSEIPEMPDH